MNSPTNDKLVTAARDAVQLLSCTIGIDQAEADRIHEARDALLIALAELAAKKRDAPNRIETPRR